MKTNINLIVTFLIHQILQSQCLDAVMYNKHYKKSENHTVIWSRLGDNLELPCTEKTPQNIVWNKNSFIYLRRAAIVEIKNLTAQDSGIYECYFKGVYKIIKTFTINIIVEPSDPSIVGYMNNSEITLIELKNNVQNLSCITTGSNPPAKLTWSIIYSNGSIDSESSSKLISFTDTYESNEKKLFTTFSYITLIIKKNLNNKFISCYIPDNNIFLKKKSTQLLINVKYVPDTPVIQLEKSEYVEGEKMSISCVSQIANPIPIVYWQKRNINNLDNVNWITKTQDNFIKNSKKRFDKKNPILYIYSSIANRIDNDIIFNCCVKNSLNLNNPKCKDTRLTVFYGPDSVDIEYDDVGRLNVVQEATCTSNLCKPKCEIYWIVDDGIVIRMSQKKLISKKNGIISKNSIKYTINDEKQTYKIKCVTKNEKTGNVIEREQFIHILRKPHNVFIEGTENDEYSYSEGDTLNLNCISENAYPKPLMKWCIDYNKSSLVENDYIVENKKCNEMPSKYLNGIVNKPGIDSRKLGFVLSKRDNGKIIYCNVTNEATTLPILAPVKITVFYLANILNMSINKEIIYEGEEVTITCTSGASNPVSTIFWGNVTSHLNKMDENELEDEINYYNMFDNYKKTSEVIRAKTNYEGWITIDHITFIATAKHHKLSIQCEVTNNKNKKYVRKNYFLKVLHKPYFGEKSRRIIYVKQHDDVKINAFARGNPEKVEFKWFHESSPLSKLLELNSRESNKTHTNTSTFFSRYHLVNPFILLIKNVTFKDSANFSILATNSIGQSMLHIKILIKENSLNSFSVFPAYILTKKNVMFAVILIVKKCSFENANTYPNYHNKIKSIHVPNNYSQSVAHLNCQSISTLSALAQFRKSHKIKNNSQNCVFNTSDYNLSKDDWSSELRSKSIKLKNTCQDSGVVDMHGCDSATSSGTNDSHCSGHGHLV
ncbi:hypothetical protein A3Q56_04239 [Intoshia linei]|uniref:Ig-like domain-containing protein n=1 Tax=Intoshia linei TaxID=1819745 RepID=A0A177B342_9BILA|nr:hypothetical protein A3Q56_04239 [Intoshia linei]